MPGGEGELVHGDDRPGVDLDDVGVDVEFAQRLLEDGGFFADELFLALGVAVLGVGQAVPAREMIFAQLLGPGGRSGCRGFSMLGRLTMMSVRGAAGLGGGLGGWLRVRLLASSFSSTAVSVLRIYRRGFGFFVCDFGIARDEAGEGGEFWEPGKENWNRGLRTLKLEQASIARAEAWKTRSSAARRRPRKIAVMRASRVPTVLKWVGDRRRRRCR